ncbi:MAG: hypothetical protein ACLSAW_03025 [Bacteroides stercoris]
MKGGVYRMLTIERSILESINGSDSRISKFLDEAEQMSGAAPDSD